MYIKSIPWFGDKSCLDKYVRAENFNRFFNTVGLEITYEKRSKFDRLIDWVFSKWHREPFDLEASYLEYGYRYLICSGVRILGVCFDLYWCKDYSWYTCDCGWHSPEEPYVLRDNDKKFLGMAKFSHLSKDRTINYKEVDGATIYPRCGKSSYVSNPEYSGYDWTEIHYCPICKEEYEFDNSSY